MLPEYVWDAGVLEGNPFTFPEVKTLLEGVTVGGRKVSDEQQILNLAESSKYLLELVKQKQFRLDKEAFCALNARVARNEAFEWGHFRGEGAETAFTPDVLLGKQGRYTPFPTERGARRLNEVFASGVRALQENVANPFERAAASFLFGALQQFFFDGNKRTSRFMMNGVLMSEGIDAISIPAIRAQAFNTRMVDFYLTRDATQMMAFVLECHPEIVRIRELNPGLAVIRDLPNIKYHSISEPPQLPDVSRGPTIPDEQRAHKSPEEIRRDAAQEWRATYGDGARERATARDLADDIDKKSAQRAHDADRDLDRES
jgi:prophage maintenance system killer protein